MSLAIVASPREEYLHFSYSQLNTYLICPAKYAHQYVWGTPWETKPAALAFGGAVHKAVETYYTTLKETGEVISAEQLVSSFEGIMESEEKRSEVRWSYKNGDDLESLLKQGGELLRLFHSEITPRRIRAVEFPFSISIPDSNTPGRDLPIKLVGVFDLIEADEDGTYVVGELKTSSQKYSSLKLDYDLQPTVYSYAMIRMNLAKAPESCLVRYDVLLKTKKPSFERYFITRTQADHHRLIQLMNEVLRAIEQRIFYRNTGWQCGDCQFKKTCFGG